jgi:diguanylate cyclase (GGDEF)-like protein
VYAAVSLVPVLMLGVVLIRVLNSEADSRGLAEGRTEANLVARTTIAPLLTTSDLNAGLSPADHQALVLRSALVVHEGQVLRLRVRDLRGHVVFSSDDSTAEADPEALEAAHGQTVAHLTRLNDDDDSGPAGPRAVEVYEPLRSAQTNKQVGVLELYLPYAPIAANVASGMRTVSIALGVGLAGLWICLLAVSGSVTRRLRRQVRVNARLAREDQLTGLPNRTQFTELIARAALDSCEQSPAAVVIVDLDRFKQVNDTLGHDNGDRLLVALADRLAHRVGSAGTVARLGGDEFGIVLPHVGGADQTYVLLSGLRSGLTYPVELDGIPVTVEASMGFALTPHDGLDAGSLLQHADVAMYVAKCQHRGIVAYEPGHESHDASALALIAELAEAISSDQLVLHYQPKVDLRSGRVTSVEALLRWRHPTRGLLFPDAFIPSAEQTELIDPMTWWVLRTAARALPALDPNGALSVAVNISARSLTRPTFADDLLSVVAGTGVSPRRIILEVTETLLLDDPASAAVTLGRLHDAGFKISVDDFGAGQTSLGYLATLPVDEVKIDKSFVLSMLSNRRNSAIVQSIIDLGHTLGFTVTAEGVETSAMLEQLQAFGCDTAQGYLISRPVALGSVARYIAERNQVLVEPLR